MSAEDKLSIYLSACPEGILCVGGNDLKELIAWIARIENKLEAVTKERDALAARLKGSQHEPAAIT